ncbi:nitroreductase family protein [Microtetraspora sp. AC03309]|uniref:nitroreductase family protein n=1 Tax=Microtetraspora sp. AC03309 TaxID=2779376 RepID=UPI0035B0CC49
MNSRRAVRAFSDKPVPKQVLQRVLAAATRAPRVGTCSRGRCTSWRASLWLS